MKLKYTLAALAATTLAANAAVVVSTTPSGNGAEANLVLTQTFTSGSLGTETSLSTIGIFGPFDNDGGDPVGPFTIELYLDADQDPLTQPLGALVASSTNTITLGLLNVESIANFSGEVLADNTVYSLIFTSGTPGTPANVRVGLEGAVAPTGALGATGRLFNGTATPFGDAYELAFNVNTVVPEPSSTALLGLGGLALILRRRK